MSSGTCPEPGGVAFSTRTSYNGPYHSDSQVTYSCNNGGGGSITCQSDGTWTQKPTCPPDTGIETTTPPVVPDTTVTPDSVNVTNTNCTNVDRCRNTYDSINRYFYRTYWSLTSVPQDIPVEAVKVFLGGNSITSLPAGVFRNLTKCTTLALPLNEISLIEQGAFDSLENLEELYLGGNNIRSFGEANEWMGLDSLKQLNLEFNLVSKLSERAFETFISLETLNLYGNFISSIEVGALRIPSLKELELGYNEIATVATITFIGMFSLQELSLDRNQISHIEEGAFDSLYSLTELHLHNNSMTSLSPDLFINMPRPLELILSIPDFVNTNMWNCSSLCWLKHEEQHETIDGYYLPICTTGGDWSSLQCGDPGESHTDGRDGSSLHCGDPSEPYTQILR